MRSILSLLLILILSAVCLPGCGEEEYYPAAPAEQTDSFAYTTDKAIEIGDLTIGSPGRTQTPSDEQNVVISDPAQTPATPSAAVERKIIYSASVNLVVDDFNPVSARIDALAKQFGGFIARSNLYGSEGEPRRGEWTLRVPADQYNALVQGAQKIGQVRSLSSDSQEVTAEYIDLESRIRNLRVEEQRLHSHLAESTKTLKDILAIEHELSRVRGEIERYEGQLNLLKDLTSLSTVQISVEEIKDYVPEPTEEPGYTTQVARVWGSSIDAVGTFFTWLSLAIVGLTPWLVVILPLLVAFMYVLRRLARRMRAARNKPVTVKA